MRRPSRLKHADGSESVVGSVNPGGAGNWCCQTRAEPSWEVVIRSLSSGVNFKEVTGPACSKGSLTGLPTRASQIRATPVSERVARRLPSALKQKKAKGRSAPFILSLIHISEPTRLL